MTTGKPLSVCAQHAPFETTLVDLTDGTLHITAERLAVLRAECATHIGQCRRGPIIAIPTTVVPDGR